MRIYPHSRQAGFAPILIALGVVSMLAVLSLTTQLSSRVSNRRLVSKLDRLEAFYTNELTAWHAFLRKEESLASRNFEIEHVNTYDGGEEQYDSRSGYANGLTVTRQYAPTQSLIRRYRPGGTQYREVSGATCANTSFSGPAKYRVCLHRGVAKPPTQVANLAIAGSMGCVLINDWPYCWGGGGSSRSPYFLIPQKVNATLAPGEAFKSLHRVGKISGITNQGRLYQFIPNGAHLGWDASSLDLSLIGSQMIKSLNQSCLTTSSKRLYCWDNSGQYLSEVENAPGGPGHFVQTSSTFVLLDDGSVIKRNESWEWDLVDTSALPASETIESIDAAQNESLCVFTRTAKVWCSYRCQFSGHRDTHCTNPTESLHGGFDRSLDTSLFSPPEKIIFVASPVSGGHVITESGKVYSWGDKAVTANEDYTLGTIGNPQSIPVPMKFPGSSALKWSYIANSETMVPWSCGATTDGRVFCWGDNGYGQLGQGDTMGRQFPTEIVRNW